jgi:hypothetical protein
MICLYIGAVCIIYGTYTYKPPAGSWKGEIPPVSPAVASTMILASLYFLAYAGIQFAKTFETFSGFNSSKLTGALEGAVCTLFFAPMAAVLFIGARMRALQMDPINGNPQRWAQNCFYACTYALMAQTVTACCVPLVMGGKVQKGKAAGDVNYEVENAGLAKGLTILRFVLMLCVYGGTIAVVCSVFTIQHPDGKELTPPLSPTMQCVLNLAFQYFLIYALLWIFITVEDFTQYGGGALVAARDAIESAKSTVQFAPMLSVLFIATRMRALQITENRGAPQGWVQDGMYLASWSVLVQFMMCLVLPVFTGKKFVPDSMDGPADNEEMANPIGAWVVTVVRYTAMVALLGGVTTVITGVILMTPETANGRGALPLIADGTLPIDLAPPPPGVNDIPGAKSVMKGVGETIGEGANTVDDAAGGAADHVSDTVA